jgi:metal-responsive CopG/Arc/MetJ family transcriptional regulator
MERVMLTMPAELVERVDALARRKGRKRSQLVRDVLGEALAREERSEFEELLAEGYRAMAEDAAIAADEFASAQAQATEPVWRWDE